MSTLTQSKSAVPWGLVLAAGDGKRIQDYVRTMTGKDLPKQYVNFIGQHSMLERTFTRAEKRIPAEQILTIVGRHHLIHEEVQRQLSGRPAHTIIVQPDNKDTGPGILLPLMHLHKRAPEAIVAVFPSDHFILEEERFMEHVARAAQAVAHEPSRIVLLAMEAQYPEVEYGYIMPRGGYNCANVWGLHGVARFIEKPDLKTAQQLVNSGGLWNTMTMVFKVRTVLLLLKNHCPDTYRRFELIYDAIGTPAEAEATQELYRTLHPLNFSKEFLETVAVTSPETIAVLPVAEVFWSDWGSARRLLEVRELLADAARSRNLSGLNLTL
ncbi:MAG TPA: sugar phosphate nucleotidyltransferase [Terriglobales bacterium]|nr:sugar phosphate nucleotidyltransferase [Terriglobales bacterium]